MRKKKIISNTLTDQIYENLDLFTQNFQTNSIVIIILKIT